MDIAKQIICRACTLPRAAEMVNYWDELLELIAASSPVLWEKLKGLSASDFEMLDRRTQISVLRYFNRAKFRPIPYGKFASVGLITTEKQTQQTCLSNQLEVIDLPDWTKAKIWFEQDTLFAEDRLWRVQSTLYTENGSHFFFQSTEGQTELFCVQGFAELDKLLEFCTEPRTTAEIIALAGDEWGFFGEMLQQLIELQVLVHSGMPNVTGEDYFKRLGKQVHSSGTNDYVISCRHGKGMPIAETVKIELLKYVEFAKLHFPCADPVDLTAFKTAFSKRYENQWQPLALVLDPSRGLGYAGLLGTEDTAIEALLSQQVINNTPILEMDALNNFLLAGMLSGNTIDLKRFDDKVADPKVLPNTMSALLQPADDGRWAVEHLGGATANALLGRFAVDEQIKNVAQDFAKVEQKANPEVLFFDLAYQTGERTDNINRRPQLYDMELLLGGWSTHPCQLQLSDIFINVVNNELVLYSYRHRCRLMPRMASAYNIQRSSHPLLRFLADLQYQGLHHQFLPDLSQRFPAIDYYPELCFGNLIIQPAIWRVPKEARIDEVALRDWLARAKVARYVKVGNADQYLCLDTENSTDIKLLLDTLQRSSSVEYVSCWLSGSDSGLADELGQCFSYQLQLNFTHKNRVYKCVETFEKPAGNKVWPLGNHWFFVSIYVSPTMQDAVLLKLIAPLVQRYENLIESWFYVLYADPERHIRFRIKWKTEASLAERWLIAAEIGNWLGQFAISDMAIRPYAPEWQRYGVDTMPLVEDFFHLDSTEALLEMQLSEKERLQSCFTWINDFLHLVYPDGQQRKAFIKKMATVFSAEMGWGHLQFKHINQTWRSLYHTESTYLVSNKQRCVWQCITSKSIPEKQTQLLADLIHMHVNRRFLNHARLHEAQLYQFLYLYSQRTAVLVPKEYLVER